MAPYKMNVDMAATLDYGIDPNTRNRLAAAQSAPFSIFVFCYLVI